MSEQTLSNDGDELDYFYHLLKDEPSIEKIAFPIFSNELFVWSQKDLFQLHERQRLLILAQNEADLLVLPLAENIPTKELALEYLIRYVVFKVFNNREIRNKLLDYYHTHYPSPLEGKLYNSLVYLMWQEQIGLRYHDILIERLRSNPVAKHTFVLAMRALETYFDTTSADTALASKKSFQFLLKRYLNQNFGFPADERESLINSFLGKWFAQLREMPFEKLCHEVFYTDRVIKTDFIDEWRGEHTQKRYPEGGFVSLDAEVEEADGSKTTMLNILQTFHAGDVKFTDEKRKQLDEAIGKKARIFLELFFLGYSDKEIADLMGYKDQSSISKLRKKVRENYGLAKEIIVE